MGLMAIHLILLAANKVWLSLIGGCMWMWKSLQLVGSGEWIKDAIEGCTLVDVTDGSYIKERYPHLCSAAFILECSKGSGRVSGSFPECYQGENAYRG